MRQSIKLLFVVLAIFFVGCTTTKTLQDVQVTDYKGKKLSSIDDFRENSIKGPQNIDINDYVLQITGLVDNPANYSYEEVLDHPKYSKNVRLDCVEGWSVDILWKGVLMKDILKETAISPEANTIIFYANDGYSTSFPLEYIMDNDIILAYEMNNVTMPPERGFPFQLVAESKWGYKWIKWVTRIELSDDESYEGYWESRGYSNTGDLDKGYFD